MTAGELVRHYERISDAPDAVVRLRRFVLDLAVRGKLVPPGLADEPADLLLERLRSERGRRVAAGKFREPASVPRLGREKLPFSPPSHWGWARLIDLAQPSYGFAFASGQFNSSKRGMPLIRIRDISGTDTEAYFDGPFDPGYLVNAGDYLVGMDGAFNLRHWRGKPGLLNQRVLRINDWRCGVSSEFVKLPLQFILDYLHGQTSQTTVKHLSAKQVNGIEIPLPPLAEQHRIVAKVDELMALCDRLEATRAEREAARDRLTAASMARLNTPVSETFREDARFTLDALTALTTRPEQIEQLRQTIRNLGIRGRLVPQDFNDEPAKALLSRIADARSKQKLTGRRRTSTAPLSEAPSAAYFDLPAAWSVARWDDITAKIGDIDHKMPEQVATGIPYVSPRDFLPRNQIDFDRAKCISRADYERLASKIRPEVGDIIFPRYGTIGENRLVEGSREFLASYSCCVIKVLHGYIDPGYQFLFSISDICRTQARAAENKTTQANVGIQSIKEFLVPVPPLHEQQRIVQKVRKLIEICDGLESAIRDGNDHRRRLLDALLQQAIQPAQPKEPVE